MIIALAGRRIDDHKASISRFPLQNVALVRQRLIDLFKSINAKGLVCGAACGADLIALDVAEELGLRQRIVLSSEPEEFRKSSVTDRPGDWGKRFDTVCKRLKETDDVVVTKSPAKEDELYLEVNKKIFEEAILVTENYFNDSKTQDGQVAPGRQITTVVVWDGSSRGKKDITADFAGIGRSHGFEVIEILTK